MSIYDAANAIGRGIEQPKTSELVGLSSQIDGLISECFDSVINIENAYNRLMNPTPKEVGQNSPPVPTPTTVEARMSGHVDGLRALNSRLMMLAKQFNSAV